MNKTLFFLISLALVCRIHAQNVSINDDGSAANSKAILDIDISTNDKGVLIPRLTQAQIDAMDAGFGASETGMMVYNTDANAFQHYVNGSGWIESGGATKTTAPAAGTDDITLGYAVGSFWNDVTNDKSYICLDNTDGAAVWKEITLSGIYGGSGSLTGNTVVTQGSNTLAFTSTATDGFSVDGTTFSVDAANNRVGIGTAAPGYTLDANGTARTAGVHYFGTAGANFDGTNQGGSLELGPSNSSGGEIPFIDFHYGVGVAEDYNLRMINNGSGKLDIQNSSGAIFTVNAANVGIGQTSPSAKLDVVGTTELNGTVTVGNGATSAGSIAINEDSDDGANKATIQAKAMSADYTLTLPEDDGAAGEQLRTDGSGNLSWGKQPKVYYSSSTTTGTATTPSYTSIISQAFSTTASSSTIVVDVSSLYGKSGCTDQLNFGGQVLVDGSAVMTTNYIYQSGSNYDTAHIPYMYSTTVASGAHTVEFRVWKMNSTDCNLVALIPACIVTTVYE